MSTERVRRVTAADVARASGVSRATVSYVLNGTPGQSISEQTRERVRAHASELGYVPNSSARALVRGTSDIVLIDASDTPFTHVGGLGPRVLAEVFASRGYVPIIDQLAHPAGDHSVLLALCASIAPAVVVTTTELPAAVRDHVERAGAGTVSALLRGHGTRAFTAVSAATAEAQVAHLAAGGHQSIAFVWPTSGTHDELVAVRRRAAEASAYARGMAVRTLELTLEPADLVAAITAVVTDGVTAVAAYDDDLAIAVLTAALRAGCSVPERLAVIGADDVPLSATVSPALTTVRHQADDLATPAEMVDRVLAGVALLDVQVIPHVVPRASA
jgi:DNA-binding LacI/PurR family transcriptional regulator